MKNSSHLLRGNIMMIDKFLNSNNSEFDINQLSVSISVFTCNDITIQLFKNIYNDIESGLYTRFQFLVYYLHQKLFNKKYYILQVKRHHIDRVLQMYSYSQLDKDIVIVKEFMEKLKIEKLNEMFEICDGSNLLYQLTIKKHVSPIMYLYYREKYKYINSVYVTDEFKEFNKTINTIFKILKLNKEVSK